MLSLETSIKMLCLKNTIDCIKTFSKPLVIVSYQFLSKNYIKMSRPLLVNKREITKPVMIAGCKRL